METTRNKLTEDEKNFFLKLSNYLDTKLYFFGSIQRGDYFPNSSDIDVDIFTHNENSTIIQMMNFLDAKRSDFKKFVWKLNKSNTLAYGYKFMYKNKENSFSVEFSIYNEKYKHEILYEHNAKKDIPFYATILLIIIKFLFYTLHIIPADWYIQSKKFILSTLLFKKDDHFVVIDPK
uniref:Polymerase nucleotidyl transferase domain-containing protein n=1 Tax=viral metagenome TaxID=1070528 RepID=A0A6C0JK09_9ZZZZ